MNDVPDPELFSAYLDGELTADEQVRVEQVLATSPEARQLLEELRALGSTLQSLPQQTLGEDLSVRVLELAERRMLLPGDSGQKPSAGRAAESLEPAADAASWPGIPWREISWRGMLSKRALIWSGVVVATGIVISLTSPPPQKHNADFAKLDGPAVGSKSPEAARTVASGVERSKDLKGLSDGSWDAPAGQTRKLRSSERLAKDADRKSADELDIAEKSEAIEKPKVADLGRSDDEVAVRARRGVLRSELSDTIVYDKVAVKEPETAARPMSKAGSSELEKVSVPAKALAEKPAGERSKGAEQLAEGMASPAPTDWRDSAPNAAKPGSGPTADKRRDKIREAETRLAMRDGTGFQGKSARTAGEAAKGDQAYGERGQMDGRLEEKKAAPPPTLFADANQAPATVPMHALPIPSPPESPEPDAQHPGADYAAPAAAVPNAPAKPDVRAPQSIASAKRGYGKAPSGEGGVASQDVAKAGATGPLMNGTNFNTENGTVLSFGANVPNLKDGQDFANRFLNRKAPATVVRVNVSASALQNKVFENLLARNGLGDDLNWNYKVQNAPVDSPGQQPGGGLGGVQEPSKQQSLGVNQRNLGNGSFRYAPADAGSTGALNQPQAVSQAAPQVVQDYLKHTSGVNSVFFELEASPSQLAGIIKQLGELSDSFSTPEIVNSLALSSPVVSSSAPYSSFGGNSSHGGGVAEQPIHQRQAKDDASAANPSRKEVVQPQAPAATAPGRVAQSTSPTTGMAKQHVVFVLNVVDRLPTIAGRSSPPPATAAPVVPMPSKQ